MRTQPAPLATKSSPKQKVFVIHIISRHLLWVLGICTEGDRWTGLNRTMENSSEEILNVYPVLGTPYANIQSMARKEGMQTGKFCVAVEDGGDEKTRVLCNMERHLGEGVKGSPGWRRLLKREARRTASLWTSPRHGPLLPYPTQSLWERVLRPGKANSPTYPLCTEHHLQSILWGGCLSPVGPALIWKSFGKMFRQDETEGIKLMGSFATSVMAKQSLKQGWVSRNCPWPKPSI